jgi:hypothetical protein
MKIRICFHDTQGLQNDAMILANTIGDTHKIDFVKYNEIDIVKNNDVLCQNNCDLQFFLEHVHQSLSLSCKLNIFIPNLEWLNQRDYQLSQNMKIVAKTFQAHNKLQQMYPSKVEYLGWTSLDRKIETVDKKFDNFIHVKGISKYKQSQMVIDTWCQNPSWPHLTIVSYGQTNSNGFLNFDKPITVAENITLYQKKVSADELDHLLNSSGVHLCPSFCEGFGHYIVEGKSVSSLVVTTNCAPMNEHINEEMGELVKCTKTNVRLSEGGLVNQTDFEGCINSVLNLSLEERQRKGTLGRESFLLNKINFTAKVKEFIHQQMLFVNK